MARSPDPQNPVQPDRAEDSIVQRFVQRVARQVVHLLELRGNMAPGESRASEDGAEREPRGAAPEPRPTASLLPELCRPGELAAYLRLSERSIYEYIRRREMPGVRRIGRSILIHSPTVLRWLADGQGRVLRSTRS